MEQKTIDKPARHTPLKRIESTLTVDLDTEWIEQEFEGKTYTLLKTRSYAQHPSEEVWIIDADKHTELQDRSFFEDFQDALLSVHFYEQKTDLRENQRLFLLSERPSQYSDVLSGTSFARKHVGNDHELQQFLTPALDEQDSPIVHSVVAPQTLSGSWPGSLIDLRRTVLIAGPNGSGKTEMVRAIADHDEPTVYRAKPPATDFGETDVDREVLQHLIYRLDEKMLIQSIRQEDGQLILNGRPADEHNRTTRKLVELALTIIRAHRDPEGALVIDENMIAAFDPRHFENVIRSLRDDVATRGTQAIVSCRKMDRARIASQRLSSLGDEYAYINMGKEAPSVRSNMYH